MSEFEARPSRGKLEKLISAMSIRTINARQGGGGTPELQSCHWSAMLAGLSPDDAWLRRTAEYVLLHVYLGDRQYQKHLENALFAHVANRALLKHPEIKLSGADIRAVLRLGLKAECAGGTVTQADAGRAGIGRDRWKSLQPLYHLFLDRIQEAEQALLTHIQKACG